MKTIAQGAEAVVYRTTYLERDAILKVRPKKGYRHPELDDRLRITRTKNEAKVLREARRHGVRTPMIYDIDLSECSITMEHLIGKSVKSVLDEQPGSSDKICKMIGETVAKMHNGKISHGDLTTSNMILTDIGELCLIDLSLGSTTADIEEMGVDIHLLKRAFTSAHSELKDSFDIIIRSYSKHMKDSKTVLNKVEEIKSRGRYT